MCATKVATTKPLEAKSAGQLFLKVLSTAQPIYIGRDDPAVISTKRPAVLETQDVAEKEYYHPLTLQKIRVALVKSSFLV